MSLMSYAIQMELDGEKYYLRQAEIYGDNIIGEAFRLIAKAERKHAELLQSMSEGSPETFDAEKISAETSNIFNKLGDFKRTADKYPTQLEAYREAQIIEDLAITLYTRMLEAATDEKTRKLLEFLIEQEREHYELFQALSEMVRLPEDFVHHAMFADPEHMNRAEDEQEY
ncbi:MAG: ferritin family protein [Ruminococcaceae bacterium]|nr:ferritin family protein [Oscillospiraceae bacterium]